MNYIIPTSGTLQLSSIYNSTVWCYLCCSQFYWPSCFNSWPHNVLFKSLFSSCVLFIIIASVLWLLMKLVFPYIYLILLYIWLELYVFSVCTICNSIVDCRKVQFHADCSGGPTSFSTEYWFLLSDEQVQSNNASNVWTWYVDVLLSVWEE